MTLRHSDGREVKTGDIVWYGNQSCIFISFNGSTVNAETTCDRRYFLRVKPEYLKLEVNDE